MVLNQRKVEEDEVKGIGRGQIIKALARNIDFIIIEIRRHCRVLNVEYDQDFPGGADSKASVYNAGDPGSIPGLGRSPGEGNWQSTPGLLPGKSHGQRSLVGYSPRVTKSWTRLSDFTI